MIQENTAVFVIVAKVGVKLDGQGEYHIGSGGLQTYFRE